MILKGACWSIIYSITPLFSHVLIAVVVVCFRTPLGKVIPVTVAVLPMFSFYFLQRTPFQGRFIGSSLFLKEHRWSDYRRKFVYLLLMLPSFILIRGLRTSLCKNQTSWEMKIFNPPSNFAWGLIFIPKRRKKKSEIFISLSQAKYNITNWHFYHTL